MAVISCRALSKTFGAVTVLDDVSFDVEAGRVVALTGANGAGKTTLLSVILGLSRASSGEALVFGRRYEDLDRPLSMVGAHLEAAQCSPWLTGLDHLRRVAALGRLPRERVDAVLAQVDLGATAARRVRTYSLGMRQRLGLATALLGDPALLILDEPANGLDPEARAWLSQFIGDAAAAGRTVLVSTHHIDDLGAVVDEVLALDGGRLATADMAGAGAAR